MQAQHHTRHHRANTADLSNLSDKIQSDVSHFLPSVALAPHISISIRLRTIDDDPSRLVRWRGCALVANLCQLLDGALPDLFVFGVEQTLPDNEQIGVAMNFFDEFTRTVRERKLPAGNHFLLYDVLRRIHGHVDQISIRAGRCHLSVLYAVRAGRDDGACVHCSGGSASVVRRSLIPLHWDPAPLRGGQSMTVDPFAATRTARAIIFSGMSVRFALVFRESHYRSSGGLRKTLPRPQN